MAQIPDVAPNTPIASTWGNQIRDRTVAVFATTAERAAAITAPKLGQLAYIDATDTVTIYNGTAWVCVTPRTAEIIAGGTTTSTNYANLANPAAPGPAVTVETGAKVLATVSVEAFLNTAPDYSFAAIAVSGATTKAATDETGAVIAHHSAGAIPTGGHATFEIGGLTAGGNTFTLLYRTVGGSTATFLRRRLSIVGVP